LDFAVVQKRNKGSERERRKEIRKEGIKEGRK
jgi:hypothetical protein